MNLVDIVPTALVGSIIEWLLRPLGLLIRIVGRPVQNVRGRWLVHRGRLNCVLFDPQPHEVLATPVRSGAARVSAGRLQLRGLDLRVASIEKVDVPAEFLEGTDLCFRPKSQLFTLRVPRGTVQMRVLAFQAGQLGKMLGL
jgi:hypothetical protein